MESDAVGSNSSLKPWGVPVVQDAGSWVGRLRERMFWQPWSVRSASTVAIVVCAFGVAVSSQIDRLERATLIFLAGAGWVAVGAYHRTRRMDPVGGLAVLIRALWFLGRLDETTNVQRSPQATSSRFSTLRC